MRLQTNIGNYSQFYGKKAQEMITIRVRFIENAKSTQYIRYYR